MSYEAAQVSVIPATRNALAPAQGLVFDGTASIPFTLAATGTNAATFHFSFNPSASAISANGRLLAASSAHQLLLGSSGAQFYTVGGSVYGPALTANTWTVLTLVINGNGTAVIYTNGVAGTSGSITANLSTAWDTIGGLGSANVFSGALRPAFYNRALSAAEVLALYQSGAVASADYGAGTNDSGTVVAASNTSLVIGANSTFASDTGYWTKAGSTTITAGICTIPSGSYLSRTGIFLGAKKYRVTGTVTGGNLIITNLDMLAVAFPIGTTTVEFTTLTGNPTILAFQNISGNTATLDNLSVTPIGLLLAPDSAQAGGGLAWYDTSGNAANITLPASGVTWALPFSGNITSPVATNLTLRTGTSGAAITVASATNNVGIGTTTPVAKLAISTANVAAMTPGTQVGGLALLNADTQLYGMFMGVNSSTGAWIQSGRTDSNTAYALALQANGGNVGIGTTSPGAKFEIKDGDIWLNGATGASNPEIRFIDDGGISVAGAKIRYGNGDGNLYIEHVWDNAASGIFFKNRTAGTSLNTLSLVNGNVGIGTTSPGAPLDVVGTTLSTAFYMRAVSASGLDNPSGSYNLSLHGQSNVTGDILMRPGWLTTGGAFRVQANTTDVLTVLMTGNVGIGTTSPVGNLDVTTSGTGGWSKFVVTSSSLWGDGSTQFVTIGAGSGVTGIMINNPHVVWNAGNAGAAIRMGKSGGVSGGAYYDIGTRASDAWSIQKNGSETGLFFINSAGNVGIGTTSPISKLQIAGTSGNLLTVGTLTNNWGGDVAIGISNANGIIVSKINTSNDANRVLVFYRDDTNGATIHGYTPSGGSGNIGFQIRANASSYFNGGNVGIGTTSPLALLQTGASTFNAAHGAYANNRVSAIFGDTFGEADGWNAVMINSKANHATVPNYGLLLVNGATTASYDSWLISHDGPANAAGGLKFIYAANGTNNHGVAPFVTFQKSGNVGIGTTSPTVPLQVMGAVSVDSGFNTGVATLYLSHTGTSNQHKAGIFSTYTTGYGRSSSIQFGLNSVMDSSLVTTADAKLTILENGNSIFAGAVSAAGSVTSSAGNFVKTGAAGAERGMVLQTAGVIRWFLRENGAAESGANAGSNFVITSYDDAGSGLSDAFGITRATGAATFAGAVTVSGTGTSSFAGNVGIGTTITTVGGTAYRMNIDSGGNRPIYISSSNVDASIDFINTSAGGRRFNFGSTGTGSGAGAGFIIYDETGGYIASRINASGNYQVRNQTIGTTYFANTPPTNGLIVEGNVGIGTTSPIGKLDFGGSLGGSKVYLNSNVDLRGWGQDMSGNGYEFSNFFPTNASGRYSIGTYNGTTYSEKMVIQSGGNVGIGTTSPASKLHVAGLGAATTSVTVATTNWWGLAFSDSGSEGQNVNTNHYLIGRGDAQSDRRMTFHVPSYATYRSSGTRPSFSVNSTGSIDLMRVYADTGDTYIKGNVGIGTTSPVAKLDVKGSGGNIMNLADSSSQNVMTVLSSGTLEHLAPTNNVYKTTITTGVGSSQLRGYNNALNLFGQGAVNVFITDQSTVNMGSNGYILKVSPGGSNNFRPADSTPLTMLKVSGTFDPTNYSADLRGIDLSMTLNQTGSATQNYIGIYADVTQTAVTGANNRLMDLKVGGATKFLIQSSGNVGIGTTSPSVKLAVVGSATIGSVYNTAAGTNAVSFGETTNASGINSFAIGYYSTASNYHSFAAGYSSTASGHTGIAIGYLATAGGNGNTPIAIGRFVTANGDNMVLGRGFDASNPLVNTGTNSIMMGAGSNLPTLYIGAASGVGTTGNVGIGTASPAEKLDVAGNIADSIGNVRILPQNSQSAAYTTVLSDSGKHILHPSADTTARTITINSNANVAYAIGTAITFINQNAAGVLTIAITSDTMRLAGAGTTGSRTLAANGVATAVKITSTEWIISGTGLT